MNTKERSGLEVKSLLADAKVTPREMTFDHLEIKTNNSVIRDYFSMAYTDFSDMDDFIRKVRMTGHFDGAEIDSDDIGFFAPELKSWKKRILLKGKVTGTVESLVGRDIILQAGNNTLLNGDISLTGLPDIDHTFIDFKANEFKTNYADAVSIFPAMRRVTDPDIRRLQYLNFKGSFTGFIRDFVTFGTLETSLGTVTTDLNMKLPENQEPVYSGTISTDNFRLGEFLGDENIGSVSLTGTVKGKGFDEKSRNTMLDGTIRYADYNKYRYTNIKVNGQLDKKLFNGVASISDENAEFTLNGLIDFNRPIPSFDFLADVRKLNLKNLNLTHDSLSFKGKLNINFTGANIDNFLGTARVTEAEFLRNGVRLPLDSFTLSSAFVDSVKTLKAESNQFVATISGRYNILDLPDAFQLFLNKYYPSYISAPSHYPKNESFRFDITTGTVEEYIRLFDSTLTGFNNSHLYGNINLDSNSLNLNADVPQFKFKQYNFDAVKLAAKGDFDSLVLSGEGRNIRINDSLHVPLAVFNIRAHNDSSKVSISTGANQTVEKANLDALVMTYRDGVKIRFDKSTFSINGKTWTIDDNGQLEFRTNSTASGQLVLSEGEQKIMLNTVPSSKGNWNDLQVELTNLNIGDISPLLLPKNRLEGLLSGHLMMENPTQDLVITSDDIHTQFLRIDNDSLGEITTNLRYDNKTKELTAKGGTVNVTNNLAFDTHLFLANEEAQKKNIIALTPTNFQISVLERFLGDLFSDIQGYITGAINVKGEFDHLNVVGKGRLKDAGLRVNFTNCFYKIQDTDIELKESEISLDGLVLTDTVTGNPIYVSGGIQHEAFQNMFYDVYISTRKPTTSGEENNRPVLLLNTSYVDNKQFFGRVLGTGSLSLAGPQSDMFMKVDAIASTRDSSSITIPSSKSRESAIADFLVERKYGHEMNDSGARNNSSNIIYDVDITANSKVNVKVVLDELTGDEIKGKGSGSLNIHSGTTEPLSIRGRYDIEEGNYLFTFQSVFKKPFELRKGANNYIEWNGDPYKANIHFDAVYRAEKVSFAPLAKGLSLDPTSSSSLNGYREDVYVVATMYNELFDPRFEFKLEFPANSKASTDPSIAFNIEQIEKNPNEINRQVTFLIVFNSFAPPDNAYNAQSSGALGSAINELAYNTISSISGIFFNEVNRQLTKTLSKLFKTDNISINFSGSVYNRNLLSTQDNSFNINQSNLDVNIPITMFKDRFILTLGSTLDIPLTSNIQQNVEFLPDVTAEFLINPSGSIRATFFYRQNLDYLTTTASGSGRTQSSGAGITYRTEFNHLGELFRRHKKKKEKVTPVVPTEKTDTN